VKKATVQ
jgi:hypothetical protein